MEFCTLEAFHFKRQELPIVLGSHKFANDTGNDFLLSCFDSRFLNETWHNCFKLFGVWIFAYFCLPTFNLKLQIYIYMHRYIIFLKICNLGTVPVFIVFCLENSLFDFLFEYRNYCWVAISLRPRHQPPLPGISGHLSRAVLKGDTLVWGEKQVVASRCEMF